jgi:hypothetical protein
MTLCKCSMSHVSRTGQCDAVCIANTDVAHQPNCPSAIIWQRMTLCCTAICAGYWGHQARLQSI